MTIQPNDPRPTDGDPIPPDEMPMQRHPLMVRIPDGDPGSLDLPNDGDLDAGDPPTGSEGTIEPDTSP